MLRRLDKNFRNFFRGFGYPRFKGRNRYNSFTYSQSGFEILRLDGKLKLSKIGQIRIILHREIEGRIKTCTIKRDIDRWYAVFSVETDKKVKPATIKTSVGIDVGLTTLLTLSNGKQIEPPKYLRQSEDKLSHEQKRLSKKKSGSKNRDKQRLNVARIHRKIRDQRKDFAHKTSRWLVDTYDQIVFEDLRIQNMMQNHHLARSISDAGWYQLQNFTAYKAEWAGKYVEFCIANGTSQECHVCGNIEHLTLADRIFHCSRCGNIEDRDVNASINIRQIV